MELTPARLQTLFRPAPSKAQETQPARRPRRTISQLIERWYGPHAALLSLYR